MSEGDRPNILVIWGDDRPLRVPKLFNLRTDHFERAATAVMTQLLATFKDFPPRQKAANFTIDQVVAKLENALTQGR